ncbi:MAG: hypothetical protein JAY88_14820 [Candidatus Thiodiazotropha lotti]|nr:hypothetical protein [Candidatus Thiodiazotropha lotti]MCW4188337.1 hypothetical protein [Candidatus Thiodiazotropha lotti]
MGHVLFLILHLFALAYFPIGLFITIGLHIIYGVVRSSGKKQAKAIKEAAQQQQ